MRPTMRPAGEVSLEIPAEADALWTLVADVTRVGEINSECLRADWRKPATGPALGARFRGHNRVGRFRWARTCEVVACELGREFAWQTLPRWFDSTVWRFRFEPGTSGTLVTHSYEVVKTAPRLLLGPTLRLIPHHADRRPDMQASLTLLARTAEAGGVEVP
jgi:Polyketide cyclase / dehydrase and lipid transport